MSLSSRTRGWAWGLTLTGVLGCTSQLPENGEEARKVTGSLTSSQESLAFELSVDGQPIVLALRRVAAPVAGGYEVGRLTSDGRIVTERSVPPDCLYEGSVYDGSGRQLEGAYASVSTCLHTAGHSAGATLHGIVAVFNRFWSITPEAEGDTSNGIVHRLITTQGLRAAHQAGADPVFGRVVVTRSRRNFPEKAPYLEGTPLETKYIELYAVNDPARVMSFGSRQAAEADGVALAAELNTVFAGSGLSPRVRVVLAGQLTLDAEPYSVNIGGNGEVSSGALLNDFNAWADSADLPHHDLHVLLSGRDFDGPTIGLAPMGGMCLAGYSGVIVEATLGMSALPVETTAHEIGHTLNMDHDGDNGCPMSGFLMAPVAVNGGLSSPRFSSCSQQEYQHFLEAFRPRCIENLPHGSSIDVCGDGVVSGAEACDCGSSDCSEIDPCCDGSTCQLAAGAVCSTYSDGCCENCQIASAGTVCRPARDACDTAEHCTGWSAACPGDRWPRGGEECTAADGEVGACFGGRCTTRGEQCQELRPLYGIPDLIAPGPQCAQFFSDCSRALCSEASNPGCVSLVDSVAADGLACGEGRRCYQGACVNIDALDECPGDPNKLWPGACGCGVSDTDTDGDGTLDCVDGCPDDPVKIEPGVCGCGTADTDTDGDGTLDCADGCPDDPAKTEPGACGCGEPDTDSGGSPRTDCSPPTNGSGGNGGGGDGDGDGDDDDRTGDKIVACSCRMGPKAGGPPGFWTLALLVPWWLRRRRSPAW